MIKIDLKEFEEKLSQMTLGDLVDAEDAERAQGNTAAMIGNTLHYQTRVAALALGVPKQELMKIPANQGARLTMRVFILLFGNSSEAETLGVIQET